MSKDAAKRFVKDLKSDEKIRDKASGLTDVDTILGFAKDNGYDISPDELREACENVELSDEELENVAGGKKQFFASGEQVGGFLCF